MALPLSRVRRSESSPNPINPSRPASSLFPITGASDTVDAWGGMPGAHTTDCNLLALRIEGLEIPGWPEGTVVITSEEIVPREGDLVLVHNYGNEKSRGEGIVGYGTIAIWGRRSEIIGLDGKPVRGRLQEITPVVGFLHQQGIEDDGVETRHTLHMSGFRFVEGSVVRANTIELPVFRGDEDSDEINWLMERSYGPAFRTGKLRARHSLDCMVVPFPRPAGVNESTFGKQIPDDIVWFAIRKSGIDYTEVTIAGFRPVKRVPVGRVGMFLEQDRPAGFVGVGTNIPGFASGLFRHIRQGALTSDWPEEKGQEREFLTTGINDRISLQCVALFSNDGGIQRTRYAKNGFTGKMYPETGMRKEAKGEVVITVYGEIDKSKFMAVA